MARGYDTTELVEQGYGLTDVLFIDFQSRIPLIEEDKMLNYVMVCMLEDGLSSPANIARIVAGGKTILTQAAGSSILAFGHAYGAYQEIGKLMDGILARQAKEGKPLAEVVEAVVKTKLNDPALGVSGLMLKDPMAKRMIARAEKLGVAGKYVSLDEGDREGGAEAEQGAGRHRSSGRHGRRDVRPRLHPRGDLGNSCGHPRLCNRRPLLRRDRAGGSRSASARP